MRSGRIIAPPFPNPAKWAIVRHQQLHSGSDLWATSTLYSCGLFPLTHLITMPPFGTDKKNNNNNYEYDYDYNYNNNTSVDRLHDAYVHQEKVQSLVEETRQCQALPEQSFHNNLGAQAEETVVESAERGYYLDGGVVSDCGDEEFEEVVELQMSEAWTARLAKTTRRLQQSAYKVTGRKWKYKKKNTAL